MKFIDSIINDIPKVGIETYENSNINYVADSRKVLKELKDYEIDIPKEYYNKYKNKFGNGVIQYLEQLTNKRHNEFDGGNTYNYGGNIMHDFSYFITEYDEDIYIALQVHKGGDIRDNYTDFTLLKFDYIESWYEVVDTITKEQCGGYREVDGKHYYYNIDIFSEYLSVWCEETGEEFDIYAYDDESFDNAIREEINK